MCSRVGAGNLKSSANEKLKTVHNPVSNSGYFPPVDVNHFGVSKKGRLCLKTSALHTADTLHQSPFIKYNRGRIDSKS